MAVYDISLADLRQDIAGAIPVELVLGWNNSDKSPERHARILEPYRVRGTIVCSDSAGLSKLSQRYSLPQVMKLISEPKEVIHAYGTAIGGEAVGVWAADNSQMFYGESIAPEDVVEQMLAAQRKVSALSVQVGMGIHWGEAYRVAGGLFGEDADLIEGIAEDETAGGEIAVTEKVHGRLASSLRAAAQLREDLASHGSIWSIKAYGGPLRAKEGGDINYPIPFDQAFFNLLRTTSVDDLSKPTFSEYRHEKVVVFLKLAHRPINLLLDAFTEASLIDLAIRRAAEPYKGDVVKSSGSLAIVLFDSGGDAVSFAHDVIQTDRKLGAETHAGVTKGEVFLFPLASGGREIAGNPVNIASKLSEDSGLSGVLVEDSVVDAGDALKGGEPFQLTISKVLLKGRRLAV